MSDQPKDAAPAQAEGAEVNRGVGAPDGKPVAEGTPAHAALQEAVRAAEREAAAKVDHRTPGEEPAQAAIPNPEPTARPVAQKPTASNVPGNYHPLAQAAALVIALGLGGASGWSASVLSNVARSRMDPQPASDTASAGPVLDRGGAAFGIRLMETDNLRLATEMRAMRGTVDGLKDALDRARQDQAARLAQVSDRLERANRTEQDLTQKLASLAERLDREGSSKVAERAERPAATATPAPVKMAAATPEMPAQTGSISPRPTPPEPKAVLPPLEGWVLRDVDGGVALIENRKRRLVEIAPGDIVPGTGSRVEAIEKHGKSWIVITAKGTIATQP